ncbi:MAG: AAA family ATPase [Thermoplasmata archaeon]
MSGPATSPAPAVPVPAGPAVGVPAPGTGAPWEEIARRAAELHRKVQEEVGRRVIGAELAVRQLLIGLFCEGHILLEGVPGLAKTYLVRSFAESLALSFRRIQFTPDMLPSDILGTMVLLPRTQDLEYRPGPIFANVVLADEINRAPPKVQSALLEAMQERQVTLEGVSHALPRPFLVIATQNPVEQEGTYPLPEAELDRFLFRLLLSYPDEAKEVEILRREASRGDPEIPPIPVGTETLELLRRGAEGVRVHEDILRFLTSVIRATRTDPRVLLGASPRSAVQFLRAVRASSLLSGRAYAIPDDVKALAFPVLNHRLIVRPEIEAQQIAGGSAGLGDPTQRVIAELVHSILQRLPSPR